MKTQFTTNQYNVSEENLSDHFNGHIEGVKLLNLYDISIRPSGYGHYAIQASFEVDGEEMIIRTKTSNMQLIDAWKEGINGTYEDGEHGYDEWDEVVESMLREINAEENL